jgi:transcription elongation GreA/GreB family factor
MNSIKTKAVEHIVGLINDRIQEIESEIKETNDSKKNESKSSAGDKYETGREMIQQVLNNLESQLAKYIQMKNELDSIDFNASTNLIKPGSLIKTNTSYFLIAVAIGKVKIDNVDVYSISLNSPIGNAFKGKKKYDVFDFQNRTIEILKII